MTNDRSGAHLRPGMEEFLCIEGRPRLYKSWHRIWVPTPSTREAFAALQDCLNAGPSTKPRGLIITGDADTGKSRTMVAFRDKHPAEVQPGSEYAEFPVVYFRAPDNPSRTAILKSILAEVGHPLLYNASEEDLRRHVVNMLRGCRVGTVIIDEMHDIQRAYMSNKVVEFLRFLKNLINETERPFVVGGTPVLLDIVAMTSRSPAASTPSCA